jgi:hypothetical protein
MDCFHVGQRESCRFLFDSGESPMSTTANVPVTISPEAMEFIDRLGQRAEFEAMIDRARQVVPGLRSIEVALDEATEDTPPGVVLWTHRDDITPGDNNDPTFRNWIDWMIATFPPYVCQNFTLLPVYHSHGR